MVTRGGRTGGHKVRSGGAAPPVTRSAHRWSQGLVWGGRTNAQRPATNGRRLASGTRPTEDRPTANGPTRKPAANGKRQTFQRLTA